jgi:hypothetical protein
MMPGDEHTRAGASDDESPGVPGFRSWRGVYWFVLVWFAVCVAGLTWLTHLT